MTEKTTREHEISLLEQLIIDVEARMGLSQQSYLCCEQGDPNKEWCARSIEAHQRIGGLLESERIILQTGESK